LSVQWHIGINQYVAPNKIIKLKNRKAPHSIIITLWYPTIETRRINIRFPSSVLHRIIPTKFYVGQL